MAALAFRVVLSLSLLLALGGFAQAQQQQQPQQQVQVLATPAFHLTKADTGRIVCPEAVPPFLHWPLCDADDCEIEIELNPTIPAGAINPPTAAEVRTARRKRVWIVHEASSGAVTG